MQARTLVATTLLTLIARTASAQPAPPAPIPPAPPPTEPEPAVPPAPTTGPIAPTEPTEPTEPTTPVPPSPPTPPVVEPAAPEMAPEPPKKPHESSPLVPVWETARMNAHPIKPKVTFRPGKGLTIASEDDLFEVNMKFRGQILGTFEAEHADGGEYLTGSQIRRARLAFQGHMFGKHTKYKFEIAVSPRDDLSRPTGVGLAPLLDWYMTFDKIKEATLVVGQYKVPFSRQRVVSSGSLQMVDRSIVQSEFNLDRDVGFDLRSTSLLGDRLHYNLGFYPGEGRNSFELQRQNHVYLARVEVLPLGKFQDYVEGDFERTAPRLAFGASYAYVKDSVREQGPLGSAPEDRGLTSFHTVEADALLKAYGFSLTGELFWRDGTREGGGAVDDMGMPIPVEPGRNGLGFFGQAGYLLPHSGLELSGRYGHISPASSDTSLSKRDELGVGVSYYFAQHTYKLQTDVFHQWNSDGFRDGTDVVRVQLEAGI